MKRAFVYWIRLPEHIDMFSQGYIGFTSKSVNKRFTDHCWNSHGDVKRSGIIGAAIRKYGRENLIVQTICEGYVDYCLDLEKKLRPTHHIGWNLGIGGEKPTIGRKATKDQKAHFSKVHSGRPHSEEWKKMMSDKFKGRKFRLGCKMPESAKLAISNAKAECKYCHRVMTIPMIARWHDEKCRNKILEE